MNTISLQDALRSRWTLEGKIPLAGVADGAVWHRARSVATGEGVVLFIVQGETALEAADAVRRAYLVEDPHLLPVQEIVVLDDPRDGSEGDRVGSGPEDDRGRSGPTTVVEYPMPSAPPLAALLGSTKLHPETARSIIGEAATGLEVARRRGVRHQFIDSNRLFVNTRSGEVVVLGVGVEAASHADLDRSREVASFQDTAALVALLYRTLTGTSPKPGPSDLVPLPSTVVDTAIPADLDLLCDLVLNESADDIPETTRELIAALEPWQSIPVTLEAYPHDATTTAQNLAPASAAAAAAPVAAAIATPVAPAPVDPAPATTPPVTAGPPSGTAEASSSAVAPSEVSPTAEGALDTEDTVVSPSTRPEDGASGDRGTDDGGTDDNRPDDDTTGGGTAVASAVDEPSPADTAGPSGTPVVAGAAGAAIGAVGTGGAGVADGASAASAAAAPTPEQDAEQARKQAAEQARAAAVAEESARRSAAAEALVRELQLDQKRGSSPFPGHMDVAPPPVPDEPAELTPAPQGSAQPFPDSAPAASPAAPGSPSDPDRTAALPALATGAAIASAAAPARASSAGTAAEVPAQTSGTQWPLAPSAAADGSATSPRRPPQHSTDPALPPTSQTPQQAPDDADSSEGAESVEPPAATGPIVVRGRGWVSMDTDPDLYSGAPPRSSLLRDVVSVAVDSDDPDTYALGPRAAEERSRQSQWIIAGAVLLTIIAAVFAVTTATSGLRDRIADPLETKAAPPPTETVTEEAPVEPTAEPTEEPELPVPKVEGVELFSEGGGEPDHTDQQDRLTDGDPATFWSTQHYASPDFGGVKDGVGIRLSFAEASKLSAITVTTARNSGGTLELRAVNDDGSLGDVLASGEFAGDGEVRLEPDEPVDTSAVALYIPELPPDSNESGRFRARIAEIRVE